MLDVMRVREDFPILETKQHGRPLVYLDNAATMQMPRPVLEAVEAHYRQYNANVHRGVHSLSQQSTDHLERARRLVANYIGAGEREIIFTSGTTDSLNQLARMLRERVRPGDQILVTAMEHHSNLLPWQELAKLSGAELHIIPLDDNGDLELGKLAERLKSKTALVAAAWVSNVTGAVNPVSEIARLAHEAGALFVVDGAQSMKLGVTDVKAMDCDFLAFSGHKLGALTGVGVLFGKHELLKTLSPTVYGGGMIESAAYDGCVWGSIPQRFEAGTPNYVGAISLGEAVAYLQELGLDDIAEQEEMLTARLTAALSDIEGMHVLAKPRQRSGAVSFYAENAHAFDLGVMLDTLGIAVRTGHMCAQPLVESFGVQSVVRASPAFYNTEAEIDALADGIRRVLPMLRR